jgi:DNA-binding MarR family transcriptional regulator
VGDCGEPAAADWLWRALPAGIEDMVVKSDEPRSQDRAPDTTIPQLGCLINQLRAALFAGLDRKMASDTRLAPLELNATQFIFIATLTTDGVSHPVSELCRRIAYDNGAMTRMIDDLQAKELVYRRRSAVDRRRVYVELTDQGRAIGPRVLGISTKIVEELLHGFTGAETLRVARNLMRMLMNVQGG